MFRVLKLLSRSRVRMLAAAAAAGGGVGGGGGSSIVNLNNRRWASSSSTAKGYMAAVFSSEFIKETFHKMNSSATKDDALLDESIDFIMDAKNVLENERGKFDVIMSRLVDFYADRIDLSALKEEIMELLKGHNHLILKFKNLLPPGEILLPLDNDEGGHGSTVNLRNWRWASSSSTGKENMSVVFSSEFIMETFHKLKRNNSATIDGALVDEAVYFIMEANHVFQDEPEKFDVFVSRLEDFRADKIDLIIVKEEMMELLKGHSNLIRKFNNLLPPGEIPLPLDDDGGGHLSNWSWASLSSTAEVESLKEFLLQSDSSWDRAFLDKVLDMMMEAKYVFQDEPEKFDAFKNLLIDLGAGRINDFNVFKEGLTELLRGHKNLILKFNKFLPPGETPIPLDDDGLPFKYDSAAFRDNQE